MSEYTKKPYHGRNNDRGDRRPSRDNRGPRIPQGNSRVKTARDAALFALQDVVRGGAYAAQALDRQLVKSSLRPEDKRLAASIFYTAAENRLSLEYALSKFTEVKPDPLVWDILNIAAAQLLKMDRIPDHAAVNEAVEQAKNNKRGELAGLVNGVLHSLLAARDAGENLLPEKDDLVNYLSIAHSYSVPIVEKLIAAYGEEEAEEILSYVPEDRSSTVVRPNLMKTTEADFEAYLDSKSISWKHGIVPGSYRCRGISGISTLDGFVNGYFSIQGESSILTAMACSVKPGMQVLDACAAPGGKSCYMAEKMNGTGRVYSWDVYPHRTELIKRAGARLKLDNLRVMTRDSRKPYTDFEGMMDVVLVDAPCSGLGVVSEKPDIKYRTMEKELEELTALQRDILENCASFVCPSGLLVYSTCTILPEENREQVLSFLEKHPEFEPVEGDAFLPEELRGRTEGGMTQLLRHRDGVEGFFIARMRRKV